MMIPVLPVLRVPVPEDASVFRVVGIDDWAWRRSQRFGTVMCDLEPRRIVALLPDRKRYILSGLEER